MSQINTPPFGLQSLLGSKNFGDNPGELLQEVRPMVDLLPFWGSQFFKALQVTATSAGQGVLVSTQVPEGKNWMIISATAGMEVLSSGDDLTSWVAVDPSPNGSESHVVASFSIINPNTPGSPVYATWQPPFPFLLPSGYVLQGGVWSANLTPRDVSLDVLYYELSV